MAVRVGKPVPEFEADAWQRGKETPQSVRLAALRGRWVVLFFYPRDFTYICPTELAALAACQAAFDGMNTSLIGVSTDSFFSHKAWFESDAQLADVQFPVLADTSHRISRDFDVLLDDGATLRATFVIDPEGVLRHMSINELDIGRNVGEILRVVQALRTGALCPVAWQPGERTLCSDTEMVARAFPSLPDSVLATACETIQSAQTKAGELVFAEGDMPDSFYVIVTGEVDILQRDSEGREVVLAQLGVGDFFGEIGLLTEARRTASVRARTDCELLSMEMEPFHQLLEQSGETVKDLAMVVRERLARSV